MGRLPVHLTIDVEAAEARRKGGRVVPPLGYASRVWGRFENQTEELGLKRLARDLRARNLVGTFYVEALGARYFGLEGLRGIVACLLEHGQDVQLHLHPTQRQPEALLRGEVPSSDDVGDYSRAEQAALLREGLDILVEAGVPRANLVAFRAGNFGASNTTWDACRDAGLRLSSNYDPGYFEVSCAMRHERARPDLFEPVAGFIELPISCVRTSTGRLRHLQITALSARELVRSLEAMRARNFAAATLVSHSFELYNIADPAGLRGFPSRVNEGRWGALLAFLESHAADYPTESALGLVRRLGDGPLRLEGAPEVPRTALHHEVARLGEQLIKRVETRFPLLFQALPRSRA